MEKLTLRAEAQMLIDETGSDVEAFHFLTWQQIFDDLLEYIKDTGAEFENDLTDLALELKAMGDAFYVPAYVPKYAIMCHEVNALARGGGKVWIAGYEEDIDSCKSVIEKFYETWAKGLKKFMWERFSEGDHVEALWFNWNYWVTNRVCYIVLSEDIEKRKPKEKWIPDSDTVKRTGWVCYPTAEDFRAEVLEAQSL